MIMRKMKARLSRPVNVLDFGADPTGQRDSAEAIQAALAKASSRMRWLPPWMWLPRRLRRLAFGRRTTYVPAGTYMVRTSITMPDRTTLCGEAPDKPVLRFGVDE